MKMREFFGISNPESRPEGEAVDPEKGLPEAPRVVEEIDEQELNYEMAIEDSDKEYADEILKAQSQIDEAVRNGKSPEEIEKLKKLIIALQKGAETVHQNLEEYLAEYRRGKYKKATPKEEK
jgi:cation transport regulator ChaC